MAREGGDGLDLDPERLAVPIGFFCLESPRSLHFAEWGATGVRQEPPAPGALVALRSGLRLPRPFRAPSRVGRVCLPLPASRPPPPPPAESPHLLAEGGGVGGSGAAGLGPLRSLAPLLSSCRAAEKFGSPSSDLRLSPPPTFRQVLSSSLRGTCGAGLAGLTTQVGLCTPRRWERSLELLPLEEGGGLRKLLFL